MRVHAAPLRPSVGRFTLGLMVSAGALLASTLFVLSLRRARAPVHSAAV